MFVRKKPKKSGLISVQVIDKSSSRYKVVKTIGSGNDASEVDRLVAEARKFIKRHMGLQEIDFHNYKKVHSDVLSSISSHKLVGIQYVLGKIFDDIGFSQVEDKLFNDLVLYRLVFPKSKLKTTEYLYRYGKSPIPRMIFTVLWISCTLVIKSSSNRLALTIT